MGQKTHFFLVIFCKILTFLGFFQKKFKNAKSWKIAILRAVFEAVRRDKVADFIAAFWRSRGDLQNEAIKSATLSRRTASKTAREIAIFRLSCWYSFFWGQFSFCVFEAVRRDKVVDFIAAFWRSRAKLQNEAIKSTTLSRRTASKTALENGHFSLNFDQIL